MPTTVQAPGTQTGPSYADGVMRAAVFEAPGRIVLQEHAAVRPHVDGRGRRGVPHDDPGLARVDLADVAAGVRAHLAERLEGARLGLGDHQVALDDAAAHVEHVLLGHVRRQVGVAFPTAP